MPESLLFLVEVAVCIIFPEFTGFGGGRVHNGGIWDDNGVDVNPKALALLILGRTDKL